MKIKCLVVDDEPLARELLESHIAKFAHLQLAASCENAIKAHDFLKHQQVDLMFLDMEMPLLKGQQFLKGLTNPPAVIVTTAHREYAVEGYEMNVVDYLLKPITFDRFFRAIEKFKKYNALANPTHTGGDDSFIFIQSGNRNIKLVLKEILFVESSKDYVTIHLAGQQDVTAKYNISVFEQLLDERFIRVHRSFIINKSKIRSFSKTDVCINENSIPIGDSYRDSWQKFADALVSGK